MPNLPLTRAFRTLIFSLLFSLALPSGAWGDTMTTEAIDAKITSLADSEAWPAEALEEARSLWQKALTEATALQTAKERSERYQTTIKEAPQALQEVQAEPAETAPELTAEELAPLSADELKKRLGKLETELLASRSRLNTLEREAEQRRRRLSEIPGELSTLETESSAAPSNDPAEEVSSVVREARTELQQLQMAALQARLSALKLEQQSYTQTEELAEARKNLLQKEIAQSEQRKATLQQAFDQKYAAETAKAQAAAQAEAERFANIPALAEIARQNTELAQQREDTRQAAAATRRLVSKVEAELADVQNQRTRAQERINLMESAGYEIDAETGRLLRLERSGLPTTASLDDSLKTILRASTESRLDQIEIDRKLSDFPIDLQKEAQDLASSIPKAPVAEIEALLTQKQDLLKALADDHDLHSTNLNDAIGSLRQLRTEVQTYSFYLDERLLWIASAPPLSLGDFAIEAEGFRQLVGETIPQQWIPNLLASFREKLISWVIGAIVIGLLLARGKTYRRLRREAAEKAFPRSCTSIQPTFVALGMSLLLSLPIPLFLFMLHWAVPSPAGISKAFFVSAIFVFLFTMFRRLAHRDGIFRKHLGMDEARGQLLWRHLSWFLLSAPFLLFLFFTLSATEVPPQVGRLTLIAFMLLLMAFVHAILHPKRHLIPASGRLKKLPHLIYLLGLAIPVAFIIGAGLGYISSVNTLRQQTMATIWLILLGFFVARILERWILVSRRKLARTQARKKLLAEREAAQAAKADDTDPTAEKEHTSSPEEIEAHAVDVVTVEDQTKRLVRIGMALLLFFGIFNIWSSSFAALSVLDRVTLWGGDEPSVVKSLGSETGLGTLTAPLDGGGNKAEESADSSAAATESESGGEGVTLQDLLFAFLAVFLTIFAAKNLPGLLELSLLRRLDLKPGGNYAVTTVVRYAISGLGILITFGAIGVTWSSVQWLAAAITLGIGFGLQEIFANFVAGIILLFERPMRLGDIVTVGDVSGKVTRIQMRATTISQFNGHELIVPNKEFITGQLVNWTLSNGLQRFDINVGLAYGSDTKKAKKILTKLVEKHPKVLSDPAPQILFSAFGASSLDFIVRAHVGDVDHLIATQDDLHYQIEEALRKGGIEISFPQTDLHIRSFPKDQALHLKGNVSKEQPPEDGSDT